MCGFDIDLQSEIFFHNHTEIILQKYKIHFSYQGMCTKDIPNPSSISNPYVNDEEFLLYSILYCWDFRNYMCINFIVISIQKIFQRPIISQPLRIVYPFLLNHDYKCHIIHI